MHRLKKGFAMLLLGITLSNTICSTILEPMTVKADVITDTSKQAIFSKCSLIEEQLATRSSGEYGLLKNMYYLMEYHQYVEFINNSNLGFTVEEKTFYNKQLLTEIKEFNDNFSKVGIEEEEEEDNNEANSEDAEDKSESIKLNFTSMTYSDGGGNAASVNVTQLTIDNCITATFDYLDKILGEIQGYYDSATDEKKEAVINTNKTALKYAVFICEMYTTVETDLTDMSANSDGETTAFSIENSSDNSAVKNRISDLKAKYPDLMKAGSELADATSKTLSGITIDESALAIENFVNVTYSTEGGLSIPTKPKLKGAYLALLSASAIYTPFQSYAGSEEFLKSAKSLCADEETATQLIDLYNNTKNYRKPLYYRSIDDAGNPVGTATIVTLQDFLDLIQNGDSAAFVTITGNFALDQDRGNWVYTQDSSNSETIRTSGGTNKSTTQSTSSSDSSTEGSSTNDDNDTNTSGTIDDSNNTNSTDTGNESSTNEPEEPEASIGNPAYNDNTTASNRASDKYANTDSITEADENGQQVLVNTVYGASINTNTNTGSSNSVNTSTSGGSMFNIITGNIDQASTTISSKPWSQICAYAKQIGSFSKMVRGSTVNGSELVNTLNYAKQDNLPWTTEYETSDFQSQLNALNSNQLTKVATFVNAYFSGANFSSSNNSTDPNGANSTEESSEQEAINRETSIDDTDVSADSTDSSVNTSLNASEEITETTRMTAPVLIMGLNANRAYDNMTSVILNNIVNSISDLSSIENKDTRFVYINAFGDIVLDDNLVILPGIANPLLYNDSAKYNPYTAAVMNSYPTVLKQTNFELEDPSDVNSYLFFAQSDKENYKAYTNTDTNDDTDPTDYYAYLTTSLKNVGQTQYSILPLDTEFELADGSYDTTNLLRYECKTYSSESNLTANYVCPYIIDTNVTVNDISVFPYVYKEDTGCVLAKVIANNAYTKLMVDKTSMEEINQGLLNDNWILENIILSGFDGTDAPDAYSQSALLQYKQFTENANSRLNTMIYNMCYSVNSYLSDTDGVLGINNSYTLPYVGDLLTFLRQNMIIICIAIVAIITLSYARRSRDLLKSFMVGTFSIFMVYLFIAVIPTFLPYVLNSVSNNTTAILASNIVATKAEQNGSSYDTKGETTRDGLFKVNTSSLTLYKYDLNDLDDVCKKFNISMNDITGGNCYVINDAAGTYLEADSLKINTDILFNTLPISGSYSNSDSGQIYQFESYKTASNNVDYYTPYYQFVDGFIDKLNTMISIYSMPRKTSTYVKGQSKDSFAVYNYVNSPMFLTPGHYEPDLDVDFQLSVGVDQEMLDTFYGNDKELTAALEAAFGDTNDWLGIAPIFTDLTDEAKTTLWATTMQQNGYYDISWNPDKEKINSLIEYINYQTKKFVIDMGDMTAELSDENLIKTIALRALLAFDQRVSQINSNLYPLYINYDELSLNDIMMCALTDNYTKFINMDLDLCNYLIETYGWFNLIAYTAMIIFMFLYVNIMKFIFPVLYILLGVLLLLKLLTYRDLNKLIKGYLKVTAILFVDFIVFVSIIVFGAKCNNIFGLWMMFIGSLLCFWFLWIVISSILVDFTNLGNTAINAKLEGIVNHVPGANRLVRQMQVNSASILHHNDKDFAEDLYDDDEFAAFNSDADIEDLYKPSGTNETAINLDIDRTSDSTGDSFIDVSHDYDDLE